MDIIGPGVISAREASLNRFTVKGSDVVSIDASRLDRADIQASNISARAASIDRTRIEIMGDGEFDNSRSTMSRSEIFRTSGNGNPTIRVSQPGVHFDGMTDGLAGNHAAKILS